MSYKVVSKEVGRQIIDDWCKGQEDEDYELSEENKGNFIFQDGKKFITVENQSWSECNVEEFDTIEKAKSWLS